jgi:hypothetical protein
MRGYHAPECGDQRFVWGCLGHGNDTALLGYFTKAGAGAEVGSTCARQA